MVDEFPSLGKFLDWFVALIDNKDVTVFVAAGKQENPQIRILLMAFTLQFNFLGCHLSTVKSTISSWSWFNDCCHHSGKNRQNDLPLQEWTIHEAAMNVSLLLTVYEKQCPHRRYRSLINGANWSATFLPPPKTLLSSAGIGAICSAVRSSLSYLVARISKQYLSLFQGFLFLKKNSLFWKWWKIFKENFEKYLKNELLLKISLCKCFQWFHNTSSGNYDRKMFLFHNMYRDK